MRLSLTPPRAALSFIILSLATSPLCAQGISVRDLKLVGDGRTDDAPALQAALNDGKTNLYFPPGVYLLGPVNIPSDSHIVFDSRAVVKANREKINFMQETEVNGAKKKVPAKNPLFTVSGERIRLKGLRYDFSAGGDEKDPAPVGTLVYIVNASDVVVSDFHVNRSGEAELKPGTKLKLIDALDSRNVVLENSFAENISFMIWTTQTSNVTSRGNSMIGGAAMTTFAAGGESLRHHDNWSRNVGYQCVWRGGSPDPSRKAPRVPLGTANVVHRGSQQSDPDFIPHTQGIFDVEVSNNYAEYGTVLCWGNKGRQVIVDGNIARFMFDYSFGSEGDENTIFSNNISVNSAVGGFTCLYWGEKVLITGNLVLVRHEPFRPELAKRAESLYMGQFIRLHHGPPNPEDKYGIGSVNITGNLFVNELAGRPSGISIEAGRDVLFTNNKVINGLVRKSDEVRAKPPEGKEDVDEFASQQLIKNASGETIVMRRLVGTDLSRVTIMGNEFISRQAGDKPMVLIDGSVSSAIVKDNVFRKEETFIKYTDAQRELEKSLPRYMLYSDDHPEKREYSNSKPETAIGISPFTSCLSIVQGNLVTGWKKAISAENATEQARISYVIADNITDGAISVSGPENRTKKKVEGNTDIPAGFAP